MQKLPGDIDRYLGRGRERLQEQRGFDRRAGAQLDQRSTNAGDPSDLARMVQKNIILGAREVVLGQCSDGLKEL